MSVIINISPGTPEPEQIRNAAQVIRKGGVVVFPTRSLYGLGSDALNPDAVERIFEIKQRPDNKPILVLIHRKKELGVLVKSVPDPAIRIMDTFWPGKVTIVFEAKEHLPAALTSGTGKIGIRLSGHPVCRALTNAVGGPVTGTSANLSGHPGCSQIPDLAPEIRERTDLILDAGPLKGGPGSTIVDVTGSYPVILREGSVPAKDICLMFDV